MPLCFHIEKKVQDAYRRKKEKGEKKGAPHARTGKIDGRGGEGGGEGGAEVMGYAVRADDAGIVSRSSDGSMPGS